MNRSIIHTDYFYILFELLARLSLSAMDFSVWLPIDIGHESSSSINIGLLPAPLRDMLFCFHLQI